MQHQSHNDNNNRSGASLSSLWHNADQNNPCPICSHTDWCAYTADGRYAICRRELRADGTIKIDRAGAEFYFYDLLGGSTDNSTIFVNIPAPAKAAPPRADVSTLNRVYTALFEELSLNVEHHQALLDRGLSPEQIKTLGYKSWPKRGRAKIVKRLLDHFDAETLLKVPGITLKKSHDSEKQYLSLSGNAGLAIPVLDQNASFVAIRIRVDNPTNQKNKYRWLSSSGHDGPGPQVQPHIPKTALELIKANPTQPVRLTEGEIKADIATALSGIPTISIPGVSNWKLCLPVIDALNIVSAIIAYDMDALTKRSVAQPLSKLAGSLGAKQIEVMLEQWDATHKGIDNALVACSKTTLIQGESVYPAIEKILSEAEQNDPSPTAIRLNQARERVTNIRHSLSENPALLDDDQFLQALSDIQKFAPGEWLGLRTEIKKAGIALRDFDSLMKAWQDRKIAEAMTLKVTSIPIEDDHNATSPNTPATAVSSRPAVIINNLQLREVADQCNAIIESDDPPTCFRRGGHLCYIQSDEKGDPKIKVHDIYSLRAQIGQKVDFYRDTANGRKAAILPQDVIYEIMRRPPAVPRIAGITQNPIFRKDGTIATKPGYDPQTAYYFHNSGKTQFEQIKLNPTPEDIETAKREILYLLSDFPFQDEISRVNYIGLILTLLIRPFISGRAPMAVIDAPKQGTGKSLLARLAGLIATGKKPSSHNIPRQEEEFRKKITSIMISGEPNITLDNIRHPIDSEALATAITESTWSDRLLGRNEEIKVDIETTFIATGNNIKLGEDFTRRCYWIHLDSLLENPHEREEFKIADIEQYIEDNRAKIVTAFLLFARYWWITGKPRGRTKTLGSFENWSRTIGDILECAGLPGFMANSGQMRFAMSEDDGAWTEFIRHWRNLFEDESITIRRLVEEVMQNEIWKDSVPLNLCGIFSGKEPSRSAVYRLGEALKKKKGVVFDGLRIIREDCSHRNQATWRVETVEMAEKSRNCGISEEGFRRDSATYKSSVFNGIYNSYGISESKEVYNLEKNKKEKIEDEDNEVFL